jgi:hypothetical protein
MNASPNKDSLSAQVDFAPTATLWLGDAELVHTGSGDVDRFQLGTANSTSAELTPLNSAFRRTTAALAFGLQLALVGVVPLSGQATWLGAPMTFPPGARRGRYEQISEGWGIEIAPALSEAMERSLAAQEQELSELEPDWDGYGAEPLDPGVIKEFISELRLSLAGSKIRAPDLIPGADGSLQAEWHLRDANIFYQVDAQMERMLYLAVKGTQTFYGFGDEASEYFSQVARAFGTQSIAPADIAKLFVRANG